MSIAPSQSSALPHAASHSGAEFFCQQLSQLDPDLPVTDSRILVADCGAGHEAALIGRLQEAEVHAVDVTDQLKEEFRNWPGLHFQVGTVCELPFADDSFDAGFYHPVIEHVDDPAASLAEFSQVLKLSGWIFIGTPNRHRLVSIVGAHQQTSWEPTWRKQ